MSKAISAFRVLIVLLGLFLSQVVLSVNASVTTGHNENKADAEKLRDPTTPLGYQPTNRNAQKPSFKLQAIFSNGAHKTAVINGQSIKVGEAISGWTVKSIYSHSVEVQADNQIHNIRLHQPIVNR